MLLDRKLDTQFQQYNKTIQKIFLKVIPLLMPTFKEPKRCKRGILGMLFKAVVGIASKAASASIRQRKSKALYSALLAMKNDSQHFRLFGRSYGPV